MRHELNPEKRSIKNPLRRGYSPREGWTLQPPGTYHVAGGETEAEAGVHGSRVAPWGELESLRRWCRLGGSWHSCAALRAHWAVKQQHQTDLDGGRERDRRISLEELLGGCLCLCELVPMPGSVAKTS